MMNFDLGIAMANDGRSKRFRLPSRAAGIVVAVLVLGCRNESQLPRTVAGAPAPTQPAVVETARWIFARPMRNPMSRLDLGDGNTLYVGSTGRRVLVRGDEPPLDATVLPARGLVGVMRDPRGSYVFVSNDGAVSVARDPLGSFETKRTGLLAGDPDRVQLESITTGRAAIIAITPDHRTLRSGDYGRSWKPIYAMGDAGQPKSVALDTKGNGLFLYSQQLFVTHDDGARWTPITAITFVPSYVFRDGRDRLFVDGAPSQGAMLDGDHLIAGVRFEPLPDFERGNQVSLRGGRDRPWTILSGERVVVFATAHPSDGATHHLITVSSTLLGEPMSKPIIAQGLPPSEYVSRNAVGYGSELLYLAEEHGRASAYRSLDNGASWKREAGLPESLYANGPLEGELGPRGWTYLASSCRSSPAACPLAQIRPAGAKAFEEISSTEAFKPLRFAFDERRNAVYILGVHGSDLNVYRSSLTQNRFERALSLGRGDNSLQGELAVDAEGTVRVLTRDENEHWMLHRRGADGREKPVLHIPLRGTEVSLFGSRGFMYNAWNAWETADGGETWIRVAGVNIAEYDGNGRRGPDLACSAAGCIFEDVRRVGWDLPAAKDAETVRALVSRHIVIDPLRSGPRVTRPQGESINTIPPPTFSQRCGPM